MDNATLLLRAAPQIGDISHPMLIGRKGTAKLIFAACEICGKGRWIEYLHFLRKDRRLCLSCTKLAHPPPHRYGKDHFNWHGGEYVNTGKYKGYREIYIYRDDFFFGMVSNNKRPYILEHRLVMAKHLGRCLQPWENVHHKNGDKLDNRIENLELTTNGAHHIEHHQGYKDGFSRGYKDGKDKRIKELESQLKEAQCQISLMESQYLLSGGQAASELN